jgi:ribosome-binding factor A
MSNTPQRREQISQAIAAALSDFIARESNRTSLITITRVLLEDNLTTATALITVLPDSAQNDVLHFLRRNRGEARSYLSKRGTIGRVPLIDFAIDTGERNRQRIEELTEAEKAKGNMSSDASEDEAADGQDIDNQ